MEMKALETVLGVTVGPLLGKLQQLAIDEGKAQKSVGRDIRNLHEKLMWMQAFLRDADPRRRAQAQELARVWITQTRDAGFDAEDAVDQYVLRVDLSRSGSRTRKVLNFFASFTTQLWLRHKLSKRIKSFNARVDSISANKRKFGTAEGTSTEPAALPWRASTTISAAANTNLGDFVLPPPVNRAEEVKDLYDKLVASSDCPVVMYVTGQSGVGKTTIVKEVYEKLQIIKHFGVMHWYSIPPGTSIDGVRKLIDDDLKEALALEKGKAIALKKRKGENGEKPETKASTEPEAKASKKSKDTASEKPNERSNEKSKDDDLRQKLKKKLQGETYLLVIDAEIPNSTWNRILDSIPETGNSKVLRIRQGSERVLPAKYKESCIGVQVQPLDEKATIDLFCHRVCRAEENDKYNTKVRTFVRRKYRKLISDITEGLPLAIVLLAGLVKTKEFPGEWNAVFEHLKSKQLKRLDTILSLCFDDLPYDLKSCFLYFAALPANTSTEARKMIHMWMAEGFLRPEDGMSMENVGKRYMQELIDRYLVSLDRTTPGDEEIVIHSKLSAFLQLEAQDASFMDIHTSDEALSSVSSRRLSVQNCSEPLVNSMPKLRSIFCSFEEVDTGNETDTESESSQQQFSPTFPCCQQPRPPPNKEERMEKHIKQLLQKSKFLRAIHLDGLEIGDTLPVEIGNVVHLQYLGITSSWSLETIPPTIGKIRNLQTLDVRGTAVSELPKEFWMMSTVRHVLGDFLVLPKKVGNLQHLQTLDSIVPDENDEWDKVTFASMIRLQTLQIWTLPSGLQSDQNDKKPSAQAPSAVPQSHQHDEIASAQEPSAVPQSHQHAEIASLEEKSTVRKDNEKALPSVVPQSHQHDEIASLEEKSTVTKDNEKALPSAAVPQSHQHDEIASLDEKSTVTKNNEKALSSVLRKLDQLRKLILHCGFTIPLKVLSSVYSPFLPNLEVVELHGKLNLRRYKEDTDTKLCLPNLRHLSLQQTEVSLWFFKKLAADLSFLENLDLGPHACHELDLVFPPGGFQSLKNLSISLLPLKNVKIDEMALTRLEDLQISYYPENSDVNVEIQGKPNIVNQIKRENEELRGKINRADSAKQSSEHGY